MAGAVDHAGVVNQVGLVLRHSPAFGMLKALAADPASGRPMSVVFRDDQYIPIQGTYRSSWRGDVTKAGAGTLLEHSIHDLDMLEHVLGPMASVSAATSDFHGLPGIEDVASVLLRFANGATGTLQSVWHDVLERPSLRRVELFCERGYFWLDNDNDGPVHWSRPGGDEGQLGGTELVDALSAGPTPSRNPDRAFIEAVAEGRAGDPRLRRCPASPPGGRRPLPIGGRGRHHGPRPRRRLTGAVDHDLAGRGPTGQIGQGAGGVGQRPDLADQGLDETRLEEPHQIHVGGARRARADGAGTGPSAGPRRCSS